MNRRKKFTRPAMLKAIDAILQLKKPDQVRCALYILRNLNRQETTYECPRCGRQVMVPIGGTSRSVRQIARDAEVSRAAVEWVRAKLLSKPFFDSNFDRCHAVYVWKIPIAFPDCESGFSTAISTNSRYRDEATRVSSKQRKTSGTNATSAPPPSPPALRLASLWLSFLGKSQIVPSYEKHSERNKDLPRWGRELDKVQAKVGHDWDTIEALLEWIKKHEGRNGFRWATAVRSPGKLLKKDKQGHRYFDVLLGHMRRSVTRHVVGSIGEYRDGPL